MFVRSPDSAEVNANTFLFFPRHSSSILPYRDDGNSSYPSGHTAVSHSDFEELALDVEHRERTIK